MSGDGHPSTHLTVMMSGLPGEMSYEIAKTVVRRGLPLANIALSGPRAVCPKWLQETGVIAVITEGSRIEVNVVTPDVPGAQKKALAEAKAKYGKNLIIVDFTHPSAVVSNAKLYGEMGISFIMGTTGGDRAELQRVTEESGVHALIAPCFNKQVLALQHGLRAMSESFPGIFEGYSLEVAESHPSNKTDVSAAAEDIVESFKGMGVNTSKAIKAIRDEAGSLDMGVPKEHLMTHAFHTYSVKSKDGDAVFKFEHNTTGSAPIGDGVVDALLFLQDQVSKGASKKVFGLSDVIGILSAKK